jgi:hypothetical protein
MQNPKTRSRSLLVAGAVVVVCCTALLLNARVTDQETLSTAEHITSSNQGVLSGTSSILSSTDTPRRLDNAPATEPLAVHYVDQTIATHRQVDETVKAELVKRVTDSLSRPYVTESELAVRMTYAELGEWAGIQQDDWVPQSEVIVIAILTQDMTRSDYMQDAGYGDIEQALGFSPDTRPINGIFVVFDANTKDGVFSGGLLPDSTSRLRYDLLYQIASETPRD